MDTKEERLQAFAEGKARVLVSKPSICGWGLNWQHAARMAFERAGGDVLELWLRRDHEGEGPRELEAQARALGVSVQRVDLLAAWRASAPPSLVANTLRRLEGQLRGGS